MSEISFALSAGFVLGLQHAADADHIAAVSTLVARSRGGRSAWRLGLFWGLGHTAAVFAVGAAVIGLRVSLAAWWETGLEFAVGGMLAGLGLWNLLGARGAWGVETHSHEHGHDGSDGHPHAHASSKIAHEHEHQHLPALERAFGEVGPRQALRSLAVGVVHGLAGSSAVALLVLATIPTTGAALAYLAVFGLGTLAGMTLLSAAMEAALAWAVRRRDFGRWLASGTGALSLFAGLYVMAVTGGRWLGAGR